MYVRGHGTRADEFDTRTTHSTLQVGPEALPEFAVWNLPAPPGFHGLHPEKCVAIYVRHLPHWRQEGATYFVTFRLYDSLPYAKVAELQYLLKDQREMQGEPSVLEAMRRMERWLDQGMGSCLLKDRALASMVASALHFFDGDRYELACYTIMPNHVHGIVRPLQCDQQPLERILHSWKGYTARQINERLKRRGRVWHEEAFDRIIRDEENLWRAIQYIGANPKKAGLTRAECPTWIRPEWVALGWRFEQDLCL